MNEPQIFSFSLNAEPGWQFSVLLLQRSKRCGLYFMDTANWHPYFIRKFDPMIDEETLVIAPEGLSRFYLQGHKRVGASWMTKEDRLHEIEDQQVYLNRCLKSIRDLLSGASFKIQLLGFSQGAATAWRWILQQSLNIDAFVIWAANPPKEYSQQMDQLLKRIPMYLIYGTRDEFISPQQGRDLESSLRFRYPHIQILRFDGTHEIHPDGLRLLRAGLESNSM